MKVFDGVFLLIVYGECVVIMGLFGFGKLILMNILGCLDKLFYGIYVCDGIDILGMKRLEFLVIRNEKIGFVF